MYEMWPMYFSILPNIKNIKIKIKIIKIVSDIFISSAF